MSAKPAVGDAVAHGEGEDVDQVLAAVADDVRAEDAAGGAFADHLRPGERLVEGASRQPFVHVVDGDVHVEALFAGVLLGRCRRWTASGSCRGRRASRNSPACASAPRRCSGRRGAPRRWRAATVAAHRAARRRRSTPPCWRSSAGGRRGAGGHGRWQPRRTRGRALRYWRSRPAPLMILSASMVRSMPSSSKTTRSRSPACSTRLHRRRCRARRRRSAASRRRRGHGVGVVAVEEAPAGLEDRHLRAGAGVDMANSKAMTPPPMKTTSRGCCAVAQHVVGGDHQLGAGKGEGARL